MEEGLLQKTGKPLAHWLKVVGTQKFDKHSEIVKFLKDKQRQFLLIQPSTKTRIDLGLKFNDRAASGRLVGSGPFGTMCTHRVQITDASQVDAELMGIIRDAYLEAK